MLKASRRTTWDHSICTEDLEKDFYTSLDGLGHYISRTVRGKLLDCVVTNIDRTGLDPTGIEDRTMLEAAVIGVVAHSKKFKSDIARSVKCSLR